MNAVVRDVPKKLYFQGVESRWPDEVAYAADTPWGAYTVSVYRGQENGWASPDKDQHGVGMAGGVIEADSPVPAFEAAQADYEARFLSGNIPFPANDPNSDSYRTRMIWWRDEAAKWKKEAERLASQDGVYVKRAYSTLEIVALRDAVERSMADANAQPSDIEARVRTHVIAGHTAADFE